MQGRTNEDSFMLRIERASPPCVDVEAGRGGRRGVSRRPSDRHTRCLPPPTHLGNCSRYAWPHCGRDTVFKPSPSAHKCQCLVLHPPMLLHGAAFFFFAALLLSRQPRAAAKYVLPPSNRTRPSQFNALTVSHSASLRAHTRTYTLKTSPGDRLCARGKRKKPSSSPNNKPPRRAKPITIVNA